MSFETGKKMLFNKKLIYAISTLVIKISNK